MNKIHSLLLTAAATIGVLTSCSDIPMPYDINSGGTASFGKTLPYKSASLSTFSTYDLKEGYAAWSQGSSYTQATGYQTWNGASTKSNVEVESYLISPALNTTCASGKVRFSFDQTLRYSNNVTGWQNNHKIFISKNFDGNAKNFNEATWTQIAFTPEASPYSDWTLYTSGYLQVPDEFVNHDSVYIAFYFYAPATASTTWELENFLIEEGVADNSGNGGNGGDTPSGQPAGTGTQADPYNVAGVLAYASTLQSGQDSPGQIYIKGKVAKIKEISAQFGNATFYISDDGSENNTFYVYRALGLDNKNVTDENFIKVGDEVVICGTITNYNGTIETKQKAAYVYSVNSNGGGGDTPGPTPTDGTGTGTQADPYNVAAIISYTSALSADVNSSEVYFQGIVSQVKEVSAQYGNATFYISDDGTTNNEFYIFRCLGLGGNKITSADDVKVGDKVVMYGPVVNFRGNTPESVMNKTYIYSINGNTSGGGGDTPDPTPNPGSSDGVSISGTTVTLTNAGSTASTESISVDLSTLGYTNAEEVTTITLSDGTTVTFAAGTNTNAPKYYTATNGIRVYANNTITFVGKKKIANVVMECDSYNGTDYVGNTTATLSADGNTLVYNNASTTAGTQLRVKTITITYAE